MNLGIFVLSTFLASFVIKISRLLPHKCLEIKIHIVLKIITILEQLKIQPILMILVIISPIISSLQEILDKNYRSEDIVIESPMLH